CIEGAVYYPCHGKFRELKERRGFEEMHGGSCVWISVLEYAEYCWKKACLTRCIEGAV
ncbi:hypothetical protein NDU88_000603, partial [Pleurodeles waltl]